MRKITALGLVMVGLGCRDPDKELAPYRAGLETQAGVCAAYEVETRRHAEYAHPIREQALRDDAKKVLDCDRKLGDHKHEYMRVCAPLLGRNACESRLRQIVESARITKD